MLLFDTCLVDAFVIKSLLDNAGTDDMGRRLMTDVLEPTN